MLVREMFHPPQFEPADLKEELDVVIDHVEWRGCGASRALFVFFRGQTKALRLDEPTAFLLGSVFADETADWTGKQIALFVAPADGLIHAKIGKAWKRLGNLKVVGAA